MKKDAEVLRYMRERRKGTNQELAAARAGMSVKTARKYERGGLLPSQLKQPRTWRTRPNPFEEDWAWVIQQLQRHPTVATRLGLTGGDVVCRAVPAQPGQVSPDTGAHVTAPHRPVACATPMPPAPPAISATFPRNVFSIMIAPVLSSALLQYQPRSADFERKSTISFPPVA